MSFITPRPVRCPSGPLLPIMVGHRWGAHDEYERLVALISARLSLGIDWENISIPRTAPIPTDGSDAGLEDGINERLRDLALRRGVLVVAARAGITFSDICKHEIRGARLLGVPVIAACPRGSNLSRFAQERANRVCDWVGDEICLALCELAGRADLLALLKRRAVNALDPLGWRHDPLLRSVVRDALRRTSVGGSLLAQSKGALER